RQEHLLLAGQPAGAGRDRNPLPAVLLRDPTGQEQAQMTIDWIHFTPWASLAGGVLLGVASALFILVNGRILGISGILGGRLGLKPGVPGWRIASLLRMLAASVTFRWIAPAGFLPAPSIEAGCGGVLAAGLQVGFGTRSGSGCTRGHDLCGLLRL